MTKVDDILGELECLTGLFRDINASFKRNLPPVVPMECFKKVVKDKLESIRIITEGLDE